MIESVWTKTVKKSEKESLPKLPPLQQAQPEAIVIGGGMAGILTAFLLKEKGIDAIVLEAKTVGDGQTSGTTAKITSQHGLIYDKLKKSVGKELTDQYARANETAICEYQRLIKQYGIECNWTMAPAYIYTNEHSDLLKYEAEVASNLGIQASFQKNTELPFEVKGAVRFENQAHFHPLRFLYALSSHVPVYENTKVLSIEENRLEIRPKDGGDEPFWLSAKHIIFACHFPFVNAPGYYFMRMYQERSYVIALENAQKMEGMYLGIDKGGLSFRPFENMLLLGGGSHRTGENRQGGQYRSLRQAAESFWPQCQETSHWSAQDCMTLDGIPYIGYFSNNKSNWYVATGFQKWGMTSSMVAAQLISDRITERKNPNEQVFSPQRSTIAASAEEFLNNTLHAVKDLSREIFAFARGEAEQLPRGHGGVVEANGQKLGMYKDEEGELYCVSTRCPHLGCQLEWNPEEKSWDCPCHGSRFDYTGTLICGPAQTSLERFTCG